MERKSLKTKRTMTRILKRKPRARGPSWRESPRLLDTPTGTLTFVLLQDSAKKSSRVKAISSLPFFAPTSTGDVRKTILLTTVSSDGLINVYDLCAATIDTEKREENKVEPVASYDTKGTRLTCVYLADGQDGTKEPKIKEEEISESEDEGEDIYGSEQASDDDEDDDGMEVEFEDEEEEIEGEEE